MKNLKDILSYRNSDFAAIQILLSIIAISLAGMVGNASTQIVKSNLHKSVLPNLANELSAVCPIPYTSNGCRGGTESQNSCDSERVGFINDLNMLLFQPDQRPFCSSVGHSKGKSQNDT